MNQVALRPPDQVMDIKRLGAMHQTRQSFMRRLVRQMVNEKWYISRAHWELDERGFGTAVYQIETANGVFSHVLFADYLPDEQRSDRVIAERWDVTMALCIGQVSELELRKMRESVPLQEAGRGSANMIVMSRGNKSSRNFDYVVDQLAAGSQPKVTQLAEVGYLYRTTAVYGSGKFGMADWQKVKSTCPDFAHPFAAEMLSCYLLRQFSIDQAEHLAQLKSPATAVPMANKVKRFLGIGNATGLGMAPYLIRHPLLISQWVLAREQALATVKSQGAITSDRIDRLNYVLAKASQHFTETRVADERQQSRYEVLKSELRDLQGWLDHHADTLLARGDWQALVSQVKSSSLETQELLNSALLELYPELDARLPELPIVAEDYSLQPDMRVATLLGLIESKYDWALSFDFAQADANHFFWYASEEKMEPRLGQRGLDQGEELEMPLLIARRVQDCYKALNGYQAGSLARTLVCDFLLQHPEQRDIVQRIQTMAKEHYGEIRVNLADKHMLPLDLLRCKLSFFGVGKFDPKSDLWVRNTMFQGAPVVDQLSEPFSDDWYFAVADDSHGQSPENRAAGL